MSVVVPAASIMRMFNLIERLKSRHRKEERNEDLRIIPRVEDVDFQRAARGGLTKSADVDEDEGFIRAYVTKMVRSLSTQPAAVMGTVSQLGLLLVQRPVGACTGRGFSSSLPSLQAAVLAGGGKAIASRHSSLSPSASACRWCFRVSIYVPAPS